MRVSCQSSRVIVQDSRSSFHILQAQGGGTDLSGSLAAQDFESRGARKNRLEVTKDAVRDFIASRKQKPEDRYGLDRLGLVLYAGYAWTCLLYTSRAHETVLDLVCRLLLEQKKETKNTYITN